MDVTPQHLDDEESADAGALDLTPRDAAASSARGPGGSGGRSNARRYLAIGAVVALFGGLSLVLFNGLTDAALFYYNVDEAVARQDTIGDQRFRMQGNVIDGTIDESDGGVTFVIAFGDATVDVVNNGAPPELFDSEIPVILEGQFVGDEFHSDQILIRHDSAYDEKNEDRVNQAEEDAKQRSGSAG